MCDIHGKRLDYFCLHHENYYCKKCKLNDHNNNPCECIQVRDVYFRLQHDMEERLQELEELRERSKRIMDGSYQRSLLYRVNDEEIHLDRFYKDMKRKLKETKAKITAFTADELSAELRERLQALVIKKLPEKFSKRDQPDEMVEQMKYVKKQIYSAGMLLYSLPNYIEVTVDMDFMKLLTYNGDPVVIRGRPKFVAQVSPIEYDEEDDFKDLLFESERNGEVANGFEEKGNYDHAPRKTVKVRKPMVHTNSDTDMLHSGIMRWNNNKASMKVASGWTRPLPPPLGVQQTRHVNKYEKLIEEAKAKLTLPRISKTPPPKKQGRQQDPQTAKSLPENSTNTKPIQKLFLKNRKVDNFVVRERFQLDGCEDAVVLKDSIILSMGDTVQKRDRKGLKLIVEMKLKKSTCLCAINGSPTQIAVLQYQKCISIIDTYKGLSVVYKILIRQPYMNFCHVGISETGPHHPSYTFAAIYKGYPNLPVNCVDTIEAKATRRPGRPPTFDAKAEEINIQNQGYEAKEIHGISAFINGHIILGTKDAVVCITQSGKQVWRTTVPRQVSGVLCTKAHVYACVQDEKKIMTFNKAGYITDENVIPDLDIIPCRLSANWDMLLVKDFKTKAWVSIVFKHGLFIV